MYKVFNLKDKRGNSRVVTEFPWVAKQSPCPWNEDQYARVMIPYTKAEQANHKHPRQHMQIVRRNRLSIVKPAQLKLS